MSAAETTRVLAAAVARRYPPAQGWIVLREVENPLGGRADAVAVHYRGTLRVLGFEFKATRDDWRNELAKPEKSAWWVERCNEFYLVVPDDGFIKDDGAPPDAFGVLVMDPEEPFLRTAILPARHEMCYGADDGLMCALFRAAGKELSRSPSAAEIAAERGIAKEKGVEETTSRVRALLDKLEKEAKWS